MSDEKTVNVNSTGFGILNVLTVIFVIAKLTGYLDWSWWLVLAPSLVGLGIGLVVMSAILVFALLAAIYGKR